MEACFLKFTSEVMVILTILAYLLSINQYAIKPMFNPGIPDSK